MSDEEKRKPPKLEDYYVDLGLPGDRVRELVRPGDTVTRERRMARLGNLVTCKSLDNRAGLYVMIEAFRALAEHECEVFAVATRAPRRPTSSWTLATATTSQRCPDSAFIAWIIT